MQTKFLVRGTNTVGAMACRRSSSVVERTQLELWPAGEVLIRGTNTVGAMASRRSPSVAERTQLELWHAGEVPQSLNEHS